MRRFVALPPERNRREPGAVGLQQDILQRHLFHCRSDAGILVGHHAADAEMEIAKGQQAAVQLVTSGISVQHAPERNASQIFQYPEEIISRLAQMDNDRQVRFCSQDNLFLQHTDLFLHKLFGPILVEADLTDSTPGMVGQMFPDEIKFLLPIFPH